MAPLEKLWCWGGRWDSPDTPRQGWYSYGEGTLKWKAPCSLSLFYQSQTGIFWQAERQSKLRWWMISTCPPLKELHSVLLVWGGKRCVAGNWDHYKCPLQTPRWFQGQLMAQDIDNDRAQFEHTPLTHSNLYADQAATLLFSWGHI